MKESYMSLLACQLAITGVLMKYPSKHFKIGKTAQLNPYDRFDEEYRQKYSLFKLIYGNETLALIDELEQELIAYYQRSYPTRWDNKMIDIGPALKGPNMGYSYIVVE